MHLFLIVMMLVTGFTACQKDNQSGTCQNAVRATFKNLTGLDGCGYVLEIADGTRLEIANLNELNLTPEDGMQVRVTYSAAPDQASICMVGPIVRVTCIEKLDD